MRKVFVFGTGKLYREKASYIKDHFNIVGFIDNKVSKKGMTYGDTNIPMYSPKDVKQYLQQDVWIVLMSYQYVSMWKQLYELGVDESKILFGIMFPPYTEIQELLFAEKEYLRAEGDHVIYYADSGEKRVIENHDQLQKVAGRLLREKYKREDPFINAIAQMKTRPVSKKFGADRGKAVDRYYIERFLEENKELIHGDCLEIAENTYTMRYGKDRIKSSYILHVEGWGNNAVKGNLETDRKSVV